MDTNKTYPAIVRQVISHYAQLRPSHGDIRLETVFDDTQNHFAFMQVVGIEAKRAR